jgi:YfiH family protein
MKRKPTGRKRVELLRAPRLQRHSWLVHGFTTRRPNELNLSYSKESVEQVARNRRDLLEAFRPGGRARPWQLITLRQRHTDVVQAIHQSPARRLRVRLSQDSVRREHDGALKLPGDALVTNQLGLLAAVQVADCLPILLADPRKRVVAAVHAGWRGTAQRVVEKTVGRMRQEFGSDPRTMLAAIGPGIHSCCYEVGPEVVEAFEGQLPYWEKLVRREQASPTEVHWQQPLLSSRPGPPRPRPGVTSPAPKERCYLDLVKANREQLRAAGLKTDNIWASPLCTACRTDLFFSHRAEHGRTGRTMGLVGLRA